MQFSLLLPIGLVRRLSTARKPEKMLDLPSPSQQTAPTDPLVAMAADVVGAFVSHNSMSQTDVPKLIGEVYAAFVGLKTPEEEQREPRVPAVSVRKSISPDALTCLTCGKRFKSLKRHLRTAHNTTPEEYRETWGLPRDYAMVAPNYSETRSRLAKANELGKKPKTKKLRKARSAP
jgi:predicted transcriptional regulator